ncbi:phage tail protein [Anaerosinus massiliensis]|uniref:phage tail protein n=1 Tax=Massilibacillus massiliensis TaxID=1806837 RepID=UPI000DA5F5D1|nr:phage tail protein [Massilibacillus massiliensis]
MARTVNVNEEIIVVSHGEEDTGKLAMLGCNGKFHKSVIPEMPCNLPAGAVQYFAMASAPKGWLRADGSAISRADYADLFSAIGIIFGEGDGNSTFNLPDLRGEFVRGFDDRRGVDVSREFGSNQISTQVLVDDDQQHVLGSIDWKNNDLAKFGYEAAENKSAVLGQWNNSTAVDNLSSDYLRSIRPRNVALLACIKY